MFLLWLHFYQLFYSSQQWFDYYCFWDQNKMTFTHQNVRYENWQPELVAYTVWQFVFMLLLKSLSHLNNSCLLHWLTKFCTTLLACLLTIILTVQVSHTLNIFTDCSPDIALLCVYIYTYNYSLVSLVWIVWTISSTFCHWKYKKHGAALQSPPWHEVPIWDPVAEVHIIMVDSEIDC